MKLICIILILPIIFVSSHAFGETASALGETKGVFDADTAKFLKEREAEANERLKKANQLWAQGCLEAATQYSKKNRDFSDHLTPLFVAKLLCGQLAGDEQVIAELKKSSISAKYLGCVHGIGESMERLDKEASNQKRKSTMIDYCMSVK